MSELPAGEENSAGALFQPPARARVQGQYLNPQPGWSMGLGVYAGLTVLTNSGGERAHGVLGGISRARVGYLQLGGAMELSDDTGDRWRQVGGFAGVFLPFTNWVDLEATAGLSYRTHLDSDERFGAGGYRIGGPAINLRVGVSDRSTEKLLGVRVGGELFCGIDLKRQQASFRYEGVDGSKAVTGSSEVGGVSIGIAISTGFDFASGDGQAAD